MDGGGLVNTGARDLDHAIGANFIEWIFAIDKL